MRFHQSPSSSALNDKQQVLAEIRWCVSANVKSKATIRWLLTILVQTTDGHIRNQAALALGDLRIQEAVPVIIHLLATEATATNRGSLLFALLSLNYCAHLNAIASQLGSNVYEVLEMTIQLLEQLPRRLKARQTREAIRQLEQLATNAVNTRYVTQGLRLLKEVTYPKV
ncbi:MAG: hypothetical protein EOO63_10935 [Hymenobacter sp.]|nr:MAG: hypothetical protein EOO63_10935 [Hymenobacter sp.]